MKKKGILYMLVMVLLASCSNELDIAADYKEVTIVYGLLDQSDPNVHYVQVFRGFLDENTSALIIAQNPDSIYYDDSLEVKLNDGSQVHFLEKVIGPNRDAGVFVDSPNYVYQLTGNLRENSIYQLTVTNKRTNHVVTSQTPIVKDFTIVRPSELLPINFAANTPNEIQWREAENGRIYQCVMRFFYKEWNLTSPNDTVVKYIDWLIFNNYILNDFVYKFDGTAFLSFLGTQLQVDQNIQRRAFDIPLEFRFFVGASDLYEYIRINGAQTGITSLQVNPDYTNVVNGLGIFSSRYFKAKPGIKITQRSIDSLSCGSHTKKLNFVNSPCN